MLLVKPLLQKVFGGSFTDDPWAKITKEKYVRGSSVENWIRLTPKSFKGASIVWKSLVKGFPILGSWVA
jgi:hypothetical protein